MRSTTLDMTKGSPWKLIAGFALPVLLSQIFQQLYNTADTLIVGRYLGDEALAAVSSSGPADLPAHQLFEGLTMGASVTISRYFGAGDLTGCTARPPYEHPRQHVQRNFSDGLRYHHDAADPALDGHGSGSPAGRDLVFPAIISQVCWLWCSTTRARAS